MSLITVSKGNIEDVHCEARIVEDISLVLYEEGHIKLSIIYHEEEGCDNDEVYHNHRVYCTVTAHNGKSHCVWGNSRDVAEALGVFQQFDNVRNKV